MFDQLRAVLRRFQHDDRGRDGTALSSLIGTLLMTAWVLSTRECNITIYRFEALRVQFVFTHSFASRSHEIF